MNWYSSLSKFDRAIERFPVKNKLFLISDIFLVTLFYAVSKIFFDRFSSNDFLLTVAGVEWRNWNVTFNQI